MRPVVIKMPRNNLPKAQTQAWLSTLLDDPMRCHYFIVIKKDGDQEDRRPFGTWDAPFYSLEDAEKFKELMSIRYPGARLIVSKGELPTSSISSHIKNRFWVQWARQHKQRIKSLSHGL